MPDVEIFQCTKQGKDQKGFIFRAEVNKVDLR